LAAQRVRGKRLDLPFDQYQRYRIVADVVELLRGGSNPLRILDVGGGEGTILKFLSEDQLTVLDQFDAEGVPGFIKGEATALPFEDGAFDYVTSVDVYEHIEPEARERYLSELRRTARRGVLLVAPFDSVVVRDAEQVAHEFHRAIHLKDNVWLEEHEQNGLPSLDDTREFFEGHEDTVLVLPNGYIPHWLAMICLTFYSSKLEGELSDFFDRVNAFYNESVSVLDDVEPCYRYLLVSLKEPADVNVSGLISPAREPVRSSQSFTLFNTLSTVLPLAAEVKRSGAALVRKDAQVRDLSRRLAEQVTANTSYRREVEHRHNKLQQELDRAKRQREELQRELAAVTNTRTWRLLTAQRKITAWLGRRLGSS
jgi:SAM-dependent methyltransferase